MLLAWTWCATSLLVQLLPALVSWLCVRTLEHMHAAHTTEGYQRLKWSAESALARAEGTLEGRSGYSHLGVGSRKSSLVFPDSLQSTLVLWQSIRIVKCSLPSALDSVSTRRL